MAEIATQFIGKAATPEGVYSSTKLYEQAWGDLANTGKYKADDVIMVSGSGPWKREGDERTKPQIEQDIYKIFDSHYKPLLDQAIAVGSQILVGNAKGTDQLVMGYMKEKGYILDWQPQGYFQVSAKLREQSENPEQPVKISGKPVQVDGKIVPFQTQKTVNNSIPSETAKLESWKEIAEYLGKSENYVKRIEEVIGSESLTEKAQIAMSNDQKTLGEQVASKWREILGMKSDFLKTDNGKVTFEREGKEGKYRAAWEKSNDTLTVDAKSVDRDSIKYVPLLVQVGSHVTKNQVSVADAQSVEKAVKLLSEKNKVYQEQR